MKMIKYFFTIFIILLFVCWQFPHLVEAAFEMKYGETEVRGIVHRERHPESEKKFVGVVNINTADIRKLSTFPAIGRVAAKQIIDYRER